MKRFLMLFLGSIAVIVLSAQPPVTTVSVGVGFTFNPSDITVNQGDIIRFAVGPSHPVVQVNLATWSANGNTALPGGFSFPLGTGDYVANIPGTYYFVCFPHAFLGMKGTIVVNAITGIEDFQEKKLEKVYPNPAGDYIIYQTNRNLSIQEIRILDIIGKVVLVVYKPELSNGQVRINIENLNKGMYFILVKSEGEIVSKKFLKS
jgi:plastocyanin